MTQNKSATRRLVVVGGGAGGLELVARLARHYRRDPQVSLVLIDKESTHLWKPLLHEVATGSLDSNHDEISYISLARRHGFKFIQATLADVDPLARTVSVEPAVSANISRQQTKLHYDQLIVAIGSISNDFGTKGVAEHAIFLDSRLDAERFHRRFLNQMTTINANATHENLHVVIVGGGATGIELSADLHSVASQLESYGFDNFSADQLSITLLEAGNRVLAQLPERISLNVQSELEALNVRVKTSATVTCIESDKVITADGSEYPAALSVWAAGIRAPDVLANAGFSVDRSGRVIVTETLQLADNDDIMFLGDCAHCQMPDGSVVPPRAQSAHQMANCVYKNLIRMGKHQALKPFRYNDLGSLVSLSEYTTVGNLMGNLLRGSLFIEGWLARQMYRMLYRKHQSSIHGFFSTVLIIVGDRIHRVTHSHLKLH